MQPWPLGYLNTSAPSYHVWPHLPGQGVSHLAPPYSIYKSHLAGLLLGEAPCTLRQAPTYCKPSSHSFFSLVSLSHHDYSIESAIFKVSLLHWASQVALVVKNPSANAGEARVTGLIPGSGRFPWNRKRQPTPIFLPGKIPYTEEPGGLQSLGSQRVGHS